MRKAEKEQFTDAFSERLVNLFGSTSMQSHVRSETGSPIMNLRNSARPFGEEGCGEVVPSCLVSDWRAVCPPNRLRLNKQMAVSRHMT